jgi:Flp pilus assembly protein TadB
MSIEQIIQNEANSSDIEVKERALNETERGKKIDNDIREQDRLERKTYANRVFYLISAWLGCVIVVVILTGLGFMHFSDTVIVTLLTTTTANVIGLFAIVNSYLFKSSKIKGELEKNKPVKT